MVWAEGRIVEMVEVDCKGREIKFFKIKEFYVDINGMFKFFLEIDRLYF